MVLTVWSKTINQNNMLLVRICMRTFFQERLQRGFRVTETIVKLSIFTDRIKNARKKGTHYK